MKKITILLSVLLAVTLCSCSYVDKVKDSIMDKIMEKITDESAKYSLEYSTDEDESGLSIEASMEYNTEPQSEVMIILSEVLQACQYGSMDDYWLAMSRIDDIPADYSFTYEEQELLEEIYRCMNVQAESVIDSAAILDTIAIDEYYSLDTIGATAW